MKRCPFMVTRYDAQMTRRNFQVFRVLGSTLRMKAQADSSSRGRKYLICSEEKIKAAWGLKLVVPWVRLEIGFL
jgi:hypothetical protein